MRDNLTESVEITIEAINLLISDSYNLIEQKNSNALYCYPRLPRDGEID